MDCGGVLATPIEIHGVAGRHGHDEKCYSEERGEASMK
jgi:hypothetical protein